MRTIAQYIYVMKSGRVVEEGRASEILSAPRHEYTQRLRGSVLEPDPHAVEELHVS